ncbi:hypothetical protein RZA67_09670 [Stenotrophomonas sp. C3(2023)]|uniref:hypothetical protein n=1 Tax=Stenotrophomonas sp. C3(2023) TaxID=3080277 RepID=UPI00293CC819|nr:hypothetical protein [Stenotrophomonas sp. C3(2023)]MDV3468996.1 hypothetical protein [Stenotrophomonas sp. C3(2023)]
MTEYRRHPDLADNFIWQPRGPYDKPDTALTLRQCTDFNSGRHGAERWVLRHEAELRANVAKKLQWIREKVSMATPRSIHMAIIDRRIAPRRALVIGNGLTSIGVECCRNSAATLSNLFNDIFARRPSIGLERIVGHQVE